MKKYRVGEVNINKNGSKMTIIEYKGREELTVEFESGYTKVTSYARFKKGSVISPYDKTAYETGFLGEGDYTPTIKINGKTKITKYYHLWKDMLGRCYNKEYHKNKPTYKDKTVCEEWHNFQIFSSWVDQNYYEINGEIMCLDKDILFKGNKVYSPETCIFVPNRINCLFTKSDGVRGDYPIGVTKTRSGKYQALCSVKKISDYKKHLERLGTYDTPKEAFYAYKEFKEDYIKQVADEYKDKIPNKLYEAMYEYVVEITD